MSYFWRKAWAGRLFHSLKSSWFFRVFLRLYMWFSFYLLPYILFVSNRVEYENTTCIVREENPSIALPTVGTYTNISLLPPWKRRIKCPLLLLIVKQWYYSNYPLLLNSYVGYFDWWYVNLIIIDVVSCASRLCTYAVSVMVLFYFQCGDTSKTYLCVIELSVSFVLISVYNLLLLFGTNNRCWFLSPPRFSKHN